MNVGVIGSSTVSVFVSVVVGGRVSSNVGVVLKNENVDDHAALESDIDAEELLSFPTKLTASAAEGVSANATT